MKTDKELRKDVLAELEYEPSIDATQIGGLARPGRRASRRPDSSLGLTERGKEERI